ncbi:MAG: nucleotidyltransferase family protein, partial [Candidatus Latescibacteria bacterium]|nr:nucleotidyltransferase family protein [Candidatus Latescibacterota bacterium]
GDMLSSVRCGLRATPPDRPVLIALGDQPLITPELVDRLIETFEQGHRGMVIPVYQGKRGHPVILDARYRDEILTLHGEGGLKQLRDRHPDEVSEVPVETDAVLIDLDDPQAYQAALKRLSTGS